MNNSIKKERGFTLIELLVVISIISLLASVILSALNTAKSKARDARRNEDIHQIQVALELYYTANGQYPGAIWSESNESTWSTLQTALAPYMSTLPHDPQESDSSKHAYNANAYAYAYFSGLYGCPGQWYILVYTLEKAAGPSNTVVNSCLGDPSNFPFNYGGAGSTTLTHTIGVPGR